MIGYLGIAAMLLFVGIIFLVVIECVEMHDIGAMLFLCLVWPLSLFGLIAVAAGLLIKKALGR